MDQNWYTDEDMNGEQVGKLSSAEDDQKLKYMQRSCGGVLFLLILYIKEIRAVHRSNDHLP